MSHPSPSRSVGCVAPLALGSSRPGNSVGQGLGWGSPGGAPARRPGTGQGGAGWRPTPATCRVKTGAGQALPAARPEPRPTGVGVLQTLTIPHLPCSGPGKTPPKATRPPPARISAPTPRSGLPGWARRFRPLSPTQAQPSPHQSTGTQRGQDKRPLQATPHPHTSTLSAQTAHQVPARPGCRPWASARPPTLHPKRAARLQAGRRSWK